MKPSVLQFRSTAYFAKYLSHDLDYYLPKNANGKWLVAVWYGQKRALKNPEVTVAPHTPKIEGLRLSDFVDFMQNNDLDDFLPPQTQMKVNRDYLINVAYSLCPVEFTAMVNRSTRVSDVVEGVPISGQLAE